MELTFQTYPCRKLAAQGFLTMEETAEVNISDTLPDASGIADVFGTVLLRERIPQENSVEIRAVARMTVLYVPEISEMTMDAENGENGSAQVVKVETPLTFHLKNEFAGVVPDCDLFCEAGLIAADARLINSRKLHLRAELRLGIRAYTTDSITLADGTNEEETVESLCRMEEIQLTSTCGSRIFTVIEELNTAGLNIAEILSVQVNLPDGEAAAGSSHADLKGNPEIELLFLDKTGLLRSWKTSISFTQSAEFADVTENMTGKVRYSLKSLETESGGQEGQETLTVNLGIIAEAVFYEKQTVMFMQDAYSIEKHLMLEYSDISFVLPKAPKSVTVSGEENVDTPADVVRIIASSLAIPCGCEKDSDGVTLRGNLRVLWQADDGRVYGSSRKILIPIPGICTEAAFLRVRVLKTDVKPADNGLQAVYTVETVCENGENLACRIVSNVQEGNTLSHSTDVSLTLRFARGETLWELGKAYHVTLSSLCKLNGLDAQNQDAADGRHVFADGIVLIPRTVCDRRR